MRKTNRKTFPLHSFKTMTMEIYLICNSLLCYSCQIRQETEVLFIGFLVSFNGQIYKHVCTGNSPSCLLEDMFRVLLKQCTGVRSTLHNQHLQFGQGLGVISCNLPLAERVASLRFSSSYHSTIISTFSSVEIILLSDHTINIIQQRLTEYLPHVFVCS